MEMLKALFGSKKFMTALVSCLAGLAAKLGWQLSPDEIMAILSPALAYIVGQGVADHGKERAKVEAANQAGAPGPN